MEAHPATNLFPMLVDAELGELAADIEANGQRLPIITWRGLIIDGRNRAEACARVGVEPWITEEDFADEAEAVRFVTSTNIHRRHLSESQRAMVGGKLATGSWGGDRSKVPVGTLSQRDAAEATNSSPRSVKRARKVLNEGAPELAAVDDAGNVPVSTAADLKACKFSRSPSV